MFEGWQRADVISALALAVSGLALAVSLAAAGFTFVQTRIAWRKAKDEKAAREPVIEPSIESGDWPGWYALSLYVRNRLDIAISCDELKLRKPRGAKGITFEGAAGGKRNEWGGHLIPPTAPAVETLSDRVALGKEIPSAGSRATFLDRVTPTDLRHFQLLVFVPSVSSSKRRSTLTISLSVRRINESESYADSIVVVKIPTVRTNKET